MYDESRDDTNVAFVTHDKNLRSRGKVKMKTKFLGPTKLHSSPYYRGCALWSQLPESEQKVENKEISKIKVKEIKV